VSFISIEDTRADAGRLWRLRQGRSLARFLRRVLGSQELAQLDCGDETPKLEPMIPKRAPIPTLLGADAGLQARPGHSASAGRP
jgi:hypothetical protein